MKAFQKLPRILPIFVINSGALNRVRIFSTILSECTVPKELLNLPSTSKLERWETENWWFPKRPGAKILSTENDNGLWPVCIWWAAAVAELILCCKLSKWSDSAWDSLKVDSNVLWSSAYWSYCTRAIMTCRFAFSTYFNENDPLSKSWCKIACIYA